MGGQSRDESFQNVNCFYMTKTTDISIKKSCYIVKIIYVFPNFAKCSLNAYRQYYIVKNDQLNGGNDVHNLISHFLLWNNFDQY